MIATFAFTSLTWGQTFAPAPLSVESSVAAADAAAPARLSSLALAEMPATTTTEPMTDAAADAGPQATGDDGWDLSLSIPVWLVGLDGELVVRGRDLSVDQEAEDLELFDSELNAAFALHLEAGKNRFGLLLDTMYIDRRAQGTLDATDAEGSLKGFVGELGAFYTVVPPASDKRGWGMLRVDALGGLRVSALELGIESDAFDDDVNRTFYDPYVGARVELGLTNWLSVKLRGDIAGFGIEAWPASDFSYNIDTALEVHIAEWFDLGLGYRWLNYDFEGKSDSSLDATLSGPIVELKFNF